VTNHRKLMRKRRKFSLHFRWNWRTIPNAGPTIQMFCIFVQIVAMVIPTWLSLLCTKSK